MGQGLGFKHGGIEEETDWDGLQVKCQIVSKGGFSQRVFKYQN